MNKKYDRAKEAAAKFITMPEEEKAAEQVKRKPGRPKKNPEEGDKKPLEATEPKKARKSSTQTKKPPKSAYEAAKEEAERKKKEGQTIEVVYTEQDNIDLKPSKSVKVTYKEPEAPKPQKKSEHKSPFSVWMDKKTAADVKLYSVISGEKLTDVTEAALTEYMKNHPLTAEQKEAYKQRERERINNI